MNFRDKIISFMQGRYGSDRLSAALMVFYIVLGFIRMIVKNRVADIIITCVMTAAIVFAVYRMLSKNIFKRQLENEIFCRHLSKVNASLTLQRDRIKDIKTKRYRKCPGCKNILRLPYKRGTHNVKCPKCGRDFTVHIL